MAQILSKTDATDSCSIMTRSTIVADRWSKMMRGKGYRTEQSFAVGSGLWTVTATKL